MNQTSIGDSELNPYEIGASQAFETKSVLLVIFKQCFALHIINIVEII